MKYYKLEFSLDENEIGDYPQIQKFKKGYDSDKLESCAQISRYYFGVEPDVQVDFDCLELSTKAKLTDYVSSSYLNELTGLLVSSRLYEFVASLQGPNHICYPASIYQKEKLIADDYLWMHFISSYPQIIDFSKTEFFLDHSDANYRKLSIGSFLEYTSVQSSASYKVNAKKIFLKKELAEQFDILRIGLVRNETFVTEVVRDKMMEREFSGITYEPADYLTIA